MYKSMFDSTADEIAKRDFKVSEIRQFIKDTHRDGYTRVDYKWFRDGVVNTLVYRLDNQNEVMSERKIGEYVDNMAHEIVRQDMGLKQRQEYLNDKYKDLKGCNLALKDFKLQVIKRVVEIEIR